MHKKGQVTIFIILGLVILIAFAFVAYLSYSNKISSLEDLVLIYSSVPQEIRPLNNFVLDCVKGTLNDGIWFNSQRGGYYTPSKISTDDNIAYYYYNNKTIIPSSLVIEKELSDYINDNLPYCTDNFVKFPQFKVNESKVTSLVNLEQDKIKISLNYPLEIVRGKISFELNKFEYSQDSRLFLVYDVSNKIINLNNNDKNICLSCLSDLAFQNNVTIDLNDYGQDTVIFSINDKNELINKVPLELKFAIKYE